MIRDDVTEYIDHVLTLVVVWAVSLLSSKLWEDVIGERCSPDSGSVAICRRYVDFETLRDRP